MKALHFIPLFFSFCLGHPLFGQTIDTIPFQLTEHNNIAIEAVLNEKDTLLLMLHTAESSLTLTKAATARLTSLQLNQADTVKSWGGAQTSQYGENNQVQIGQTRRDRLTIWEDLHSGPGTDGKFGFNFFPSKIIEINYDHQILIVHQELPPSIADYEIQALAQKGSLLFIKGNSTIQSNSFSNSFLIHSGYAGTLLFDDQFVATHQLGDHLSILKEIILKDSYGNELTTKKALLPYFQLGKYQLEALPIGFFEGAIGRQKMSVLGGDILKRFNLIFDLKNGQLYLKENGLMDLPYWDA